MGLGPQWSSLACAASRQEPLVLGAVCAELALVVFSSDTAAFSPRFPAEVHTGYMMTLSQREGDSRTERGRFLGRAA